MEMVYLDNAATSFPKPPGVVDRVRSLLEEGVGNAGRGTHGMAAAAGDILEGTRRLLAEMFNAEHPSCIAFTFNATDALNMAIKGSVQAGSHVVATVLEHNSVLRPLFGLSRRGVLGDITLVEPRENGVIDPEDVKSAIREDTSLVIVTHASNVLGTVQPIGEIGRICREYGVPFLVDAAQSAGELDIDVQRMNIDMMAFPGHKSLLGLQGTGGLYVRNSLEIPGHWREGGTGTDSENPFHPDRMPSRLEAGTHNVVGIAALGEGVKFIASHGVKEIHRHCISLVRMFVEAVKDDGRITLYHAGEGVERVGVLSFNVKGVPPAEVGTVLEQHYGIIVRTGLHCAPGAHEFMDTFPEGTVRVSPGVFNNEEDIHRLVSAVKEIAEEYA